MKTTFFLAFAITFSLFAESAYATVGGPTYIGEFKYNPTNESVYFTEVSESGRGCPPVLKKISLTTKKIEDAFSCEQGENLRGNDFASSPVQNEIAKITNGFKDLSAISLPKNNMQLDISFVRSEKLTPEEDWNIRSHFTAAVYEDGKKIDEFPIQGCNTEQPFTFAGYAVPGFEKKIVLLSSTKGDCFEGGYTMERLHVVNGIQSLDRTPTSDFKPSNSPLTPSESTLIVFEKNSIETSPAPTTSPEPEPETNESKNTSLRTGIIAAAIAFIAGLFLGRMALKKR